MLYIKLSFDVTVVVCSQKEQVAYVHTLQTEVDLTSNVNVCASPGIANAAEYSKSGKKFIALGYATVIQNLLTLQINLWFIFSK